MKQAQLCHILGALSAVQRNVLVTYCGMECGIVSNLPMGTAGTRAENSIMASSSEPVSLQAVSHL